MILVDSSVWIAHLRGERTAPTAKLRAGVASRSLLVGDVILMEVLQGARDDRHAEAIEQHLCSFPIVSLLGAKTASLAARNYRRLRALGVTVRTPADLVIGTFCIAHDHLLLHSDRDFAPMQQHLGLRVA